MQDITDAAVEKIAAECKKIRELREKFIAEALTFTEAQLHKPAAEQPPGPSSAAASHPTSA